MPAGTLMHIGDRKVNDALISVIQYAGDHFVEKRLDSFSQFSQEPFNPQMVTWINVDGLHDLELLQQVGEKFGIHTLVLEDILNTDQRPKFEDHGHFLFFSMKMFLLDPKKQSVSWEQVSVLVGKGFVVTFQEAPGDLFEPVRERIRHGKGRIRKMKSDYLAYVLLDALVDQFFIIQESIGDQLDVIEAKVFENPDKAIANRIHDMKRQLLHIRRAVWPLRELTSTFEKSESVLIDQGTRIFIRDVYDHCIQIIDNIEVSREITAGLMDGYHTSISNRTNQVMKVLTIVATLFIPLTFIVGVYGMNFEYMPELAWPWAYPAVMGLMFLLFLVMIWYFRKKDWL